MKKLLKSMLLFFLLIASLACEEEEFDNYNSFDKVIVPPYSESGISVYGCFIDNNPWAPFGSYYETRVFGSFWQENKIEVDFYSNQDSVETFNMRGRMTRVKSNKYISDTHLSFGIRTTIKAPENYFLDSDFPGNMIYHDLIEDTYYLSNDRNPVILSLKKFSKQERIMSGTFNGFLYNRDNIRDSISVTGGIFDVKI